MDASFDYTAPKENITLDLNASLLEQAKACGIDIDAAVESALLAAIQRHTRPPETQILD